MPGMVLHKDAPGQGRILFPVDEAAYVLGIKARKIWYLIESGQLRATRIGRRTLVHKSVLEAFARGDHPTKVIGDQEAASGVVTSARAGAKQ